MSKMKNIINSYFLMVPAILIGTYAMISFGVSPSIWMQNIIIWLIGTVVGSVYLISNKGRNVSKGNLPLSIVLIVLLALPFLSNGLEGVHRWLTVGPLNIYIASLILPLFIIQIWNLAKNKRENFAIALTIITLCILLLQPDAGQLTAFAFATAIILGTTLENWTTKFLSFIVTAAFVILSWIFLDDLAPVPYVEQILFLVADLGIVWLILGVLSLILLLIPLLIPFFFYGKKTSISFALGVYFLMTMVVTFFGNFPMPIMGYGISPIIGYFIAIAWLKKNI